MKKNNVAVGLVSSLIALVNSIILFVKSIIDSSNQSATVFQYIVSCLYLIAMLASVYLFYKALAALVQSLRSRLKGGDEEGISKYLMKFVNRGGRTVVLSRDLSWVTGSIRDELETKARKKELIIFLPHPNHVSRELEQAGADVRYFGSLFQDSADGPIRSRFTIIRWGSPSERITYPMDDDNYHYNYEYVAGDPAMELSKDLIRLLIKLVPESKPELGKNQKKKQRTGLTVKLRAIKNLRGKRRRT